MFKSMVCGLTSYSFDFIKIKHEEIIFPYRNKWSDFSKYSFLLTLFLAIQREN